MKDGALSKVCFVETHRKQQIARLSAQSGDAFTQIDRLTSLCSYEWITQSREPMLDYSVKNPFRNLFANIIADDELLQQLLILS